MKPTLLFLSCANQAEAKAISSALLNQKLAACVKQLPITSNSWWKGRIENAKEILLLIETVEANFKRIDKVVKKLHSYEMPGLLQLPVEKTSAGVMEWIAESLSENDS